MLIRRLCGLALGLLLALTASGIALVAPAQAAGCTGENGVTVIVQFPSGTRTGCAPGDPSNGIQALARAGFSWAAASGDGGGAVCRIDDYPSPSRESCTRMPPRDAYWAYFHAVRGGSWQYSSRGAASYDPEPGTVQGWRFGNGSAPTSRPPSAVRAPQPVKRPKQPAPAAPTVAPATPTAAPTSPPSSLPKPARQSAGASVAPTRPAAASTTRAAPSTAAVSASSTSPTSSPARAVSAPAAGTPVRSDSGETQGGVSWLWGLALLTGLAGIGAAVALRRRS